MTTTTNYVGFLGNAGAATDSNRHDFVAKQALGQVRTSMPVKVMKVHADANGGPPTIDVMPLVNQIDGLGNKTDHGTIYGIVTHRAQGGDFAIINDPVVGDIGSMAIHDRDISAVVANAGAQSNPGSFRRHDPADGMYHGQILNKKPVHSIEVKRDGSGNVTSINITSPAGLNFNGVKIDTSGNVTTPGNVTAGLGTGNSVTLQNHKHSGVQPGAGQTAVPVPGT